MSEDKRNQEYKEFGERLKWLRDEVHLSQKALAENLGMPQQTYQGYESGIRKVTLQLLKQFAEFFDVSIDFLAGRTNDRKLHTSDELYEKFDRIEEPKLSEEDESALNLYRQLDSNDKAEIRGEMKHMLKDEKYSVKKEYKNA